jgi:hypothetical protein
VRNGNTRTTLAVIAVVLALVAFILGVLAFTDPGDQRIDHIGISTLAVFSSTIFGLLAFLKANAVQKDLRNGAIDAAVKKALEDRDAS